MGTRFRVVAEVRRLRLHLFGAQHASLDEPALERRRQPPVVARQVHLRVEALQGATREGTLDREHEPEHPALPLVVEDRLVLLGLHGPVARHPAHVVYAAHSGRSAPPWSRSISAPRSRALRLAPFYPAESLATLYVGPQLSALRLCEARRFSL